MKLDDIVVEVRDGSLKRLGSIHQDYLDLECFPEHNGIGSWKVSLPVDHPLSIPLREPGSGVIVTGLSDVILSGPMVSSEMNQGVSDPGGTITFSGVGDSIILLDSLAWPEPTNSDVTTQSVGHHTLTGPAESVMHEFVDANIGPSGTAERRKGALALGDDAGRGTTMTKNARFPTLVDLLREIAAVDNLGFRVVQRGENLAFETYLTTDRSKTIRLSPDTGALASQRTAISAPGLTRAIVGGQGEQESRQFVEVDTTDSLAAETAWGRRIERFIDQRQTGVTAEQIQAGSEALAEEGFTAIDVQAVPADDSTMEFGRDWFLGDIVTVIVEGSEWIVPATSLAMKVNSDGFRVGVVLGDMIAFSQEGQVQSKLSATITRVSSLEREIGLTADTGWLTPTFQHSWTNYGSGWSDAAYRKVGNQVHLRGLVKSGTLAESVFTLPVDFRPTEGLHFPTICSDTTIPGKAQVFPDGRVVANGANSYFALDNITFLID